MQLVQVEFEHLSGPESSRKVVWVHASWNLRPGQRVAFSADSLVWDVVKVYETKIDTSDIYCKWGLDLPKTFRTER